jgi:hypothetical protein
VIGALTENARILREKLDATNVSMSKDAHELETMRQELSGRFGPLPPMTICAPVSRSRRR